MDATEVAHNPADAADATPLPAGTIVGAKYRIERVLGQGAMGIVFMATDMSLDRSVALKVLRDASQKGHDARHRFEREARAMARTNGPHTVRIFEVGTLETGEPFLVMEALSGQDLRTLLAAHGPPAVATAVGWIKDTCTALESAHEQGIVHRDLKPANLFLTTVSGPEAHAHAHIKVLDFGISKLTHELSLDATSMTASRTIVGTPLYMSPEQARAVRDVDARSDLWSVGVILYELLTGDSPFRRASLAETLAAILTHEPPSPSSRRAGVARALDNVVARCLQKDPKRRIGSARELREALDEAMKPPRTSPWRSLVAVPVIAAAAAAGIWLSSRPPDKPPTAPAPSPELVTEPAAELSLATQPLTSVPLASKPPSDAPSAYRAKSPRHKERPMASTGSPPPTSPALPDSAPQPPTSSTMDLNPEFGGRK
jgi:serine/threonine-protein kinase